MPINDKIRLPRATSDRAALPSAVALARLCLLMLLTLPALIGCQERPLTPQEIQDQHRFEVGCRPQDAEGYEQAMPYCGHHGGR